LISINVNKYNRLFHSKSQGDRAERHQFDTPGWDPDPLVPAVEPGCQSTSVAKWDIFRQGMFHVNQWEFLNMPWDVKWLGWYWFAAQSGSKQMSVVRSATCLFATCFVLVKRQSFCWLDNISCWFLCPAHFWHSISCPPLHFVQMWCVLVIQRLVAAVWSLGFAKK
jgi:hypothetical protein